MLLYELFDWNTDAWKSVWSAVREIEFYGSGTVSTNGPEFDKGSLKYPVPAKDLLHILNPNRANLITIHDIYGRQVVDKDISSSDLNVSLNVSSILCGSYVIVMKGERTYHSEIFIISN